MADTALVNRLQASGLQHAAAEAIAEAIQADTPRSEAAMMKWVTGFAVALTAIVVFLFTWQLDSVRDDLRAEIRIVKSDVDNLTGDVDNLKGDVQNLKGDVDSLKGDIQNLKEDFGTLRTEIATLSTTVGTLSTTVGTLSATVGTLSTTVGTLDDRSRSQGEDLAAIKALLEAIYAERAN